MCIRDRSEIGNRFVNNLSFVVVEGIKRFIHIMWLTNMSDGSSRCQPATQFERYIQQNPLFSVTALPFCSKCLPFGTQGLLQSGFCSGFRASSRLSSMKPALPGTSGIARNTNTPHPLKYVFLDKRRGCKKKKTPSDASVLERISTRDTFQQPPFSLCVPL